MRPLRSARLLLFIGSLALVQACAVAPVEGPRELDVSQLVQVDAEDLRIVDILPRGLGTGGVAVMMIGIEDENEEVAQRETFELPAADTTFEPENNRTVVTYALAESDHLRFTNQMVRLRAQLLVGYYDLTFRAFTTVCDEAGVRLSAGRSPTILMNAATGRSMLVFEPSEPLSRIKDDAPFCT